MASKLYRLVPGQEIVLDGRPRLVREAQGVRAVAGSSGAWAVLEGDPPTYVRAIVGTSLFEADEYEVVTLVAEPGRKPPSLRAFKNGRLEDDVLRNAGDAWPVAAATRIPRAALVTRRPAWSGSAHQWRTVLGVAALAVGLYVLLQQVL